MNEQLNEKIKTIEQTIQSTKSALKSWANQISQHHKTLKALSQQLESIRQQIIMNENELNNQGGSN